MLRYDYHICLKNYLPSPTQHVDETINPVPMQLNVFRRAVTKRFQLAHLYPSTCCRVAAAILQADMWPAEEKIKRKNLNPRAYITSRPIYGPDAQQCEPFLFHPFFEGEFYVCSKTLSRSTPEKVSCVMRFEILIARGGLLCSCMRRGILDALF